MGKTPFVPLGVFALCCGLLLFGARVGTRRLLRFLSGPLLFLLAGLPAILVSVNPAAAVCSAGIPFPGIRLGITAEAAGTAGLLAAKAAGASAAFGFLVLTTPVFAVDQVLSRLRFPPVVRSIAVLMYRYIFITLHISEAVRLSQKARGGYTGFVRGIRSLGMHSAAVIVKTYGFARISHGALLLRGFDETFDLVPVDYPASAGNRRLLVLFGLALTAVLAAEGM
jgi:cobalt/nickel transport system permease protein